MTKYMKTLWEVILPDFFLPHYVSGWDAVKSHIAAYINLIFFTLLLIGFLNAGNAWDTLKHNMFVQNNVQITSPVGGK